MCGCYESWYPRCGYRLARFSIVWPTLLTFCQCRDGQLNCRLGSRHVNIQGKLFEYLASSGWIEDESNYGVCNMYECITYCTTNSEILRDRRTILAKCIGKNRFLANRFPTFQRRRFCVTIIIAGHVRTVAANDRCSVGVIAWDWVYVTWARKWKTEVHP